MDIHQNNKRTQPNFSDRNLESETLGHYEATPPTLEHNKMLKSKEEFVTKINSSGLQSQLRPGPWCSATVICDATLTLQAAPSDWCNFLYAGKVNLADTSLDLLIGTKNQQHNPVDIDCLWRPCDGFIGQVKKYRFPLDSLDSGGFPSGKRQK